MTSSGATGGAVPMEVDCRTVKSRMERQDPFLLLDCREAEEYSLVKIAGATLVPMSEIQTRVGEIEPHRDGDIIVHCHHGGRSLRVAAWLRQQGFSKAQSMAGGIDQWAAEIDTTLVRY